MKLAGIRQEGPCTEVLTAEGILESSCVYCMHGSMAKCPVEMQRACARADRAEPGYYHVFEPRGEEEEEDDDEGESEAGEV